MDKWIYNFTQSRPWKNKDSIKDILGSKGAGLAEMSSMGINVPNGFIITTRLFHYFYNNNHKFPPDFEKELKQNIKIIEEKEGKIFGDSRHPLLFSVRSGSKYSMPGMMDTLLNLGINQAAIEVLTCKADLKFMHDCFRRFCMMYGSTVCKIPAFKFEQIIHSMLEQNSIKNIVDLPIHLLEGISIKQRELLGGDSNLTPYEYLINSIKSVLLSWNNARAIVYRKMNNIDNNVGTAITVQTMVFGNKNNDSSTGVCFSRNPANGANKLFGEYLLCAQGEDIVSGITTPHNIVGKDKSSLENQMPKIYGELLKTAKILEAHYKDVQDIEFTIEDSKLYILQTRQAKRSVEASIKFAANMAEENLITKTEAIERIDTNTLPQLFCANVNYKNKSLQILSKGLPASPGSTTGIIVFCSNKAEKLSLHHKVILVRNETSPEDIGGMYHASGILTKKGGMTSHAAVVARGIGKPCICGANEIEINQREGYLLCGGIKIFEGDYITIDGEQGNIIKGRVALQYPELKEEFYQILSWAKAIKRMEVRVNAENPEDLAMAIKFGAESVGLVRTEHMFFNKEKIKIFQEMILSENKESQKQSIEKLLTLQTKDFKKLFSIITNHKINIRLLDPPLHEFLPSKDEDIGILSDIMLISTVELKQRIANLAETNPMLGNRGSRVGIISPEIYEMQVQAMSLAYIRAKAEFNIEPKLEIMLPFISCENELLALKALVVKTIKEIEDRHKDKIDYRVGTMIEIPRAAIISSQLAPHVDYFSFGTNDLTQTIFGISRDDCSRLITKYIENKIFDYDPFVRIDHDGVGYLIKLAAQQSKLANKKIKLGICGEHGGDPDSIAFFDQLGLDYISCSPFRVPIAIISASQSSIKKRKK